MDYQVYVVLMPLREKNKQANKQKPRDKVYVKACIKDIWNLAYLICYSNQLYCQNIVVLSFKTNAVLFQNVRCM